MINSLLSDEEGDALRRILRHHGVPLAPQLVKDLAAFINWVHELERSRMQLGSNKNPPPYMLVFLSSLGIYGSEAINTTREKIEETTND